MTPNPPTVSTTPSPLSPGHAIWFEGAEATIVKVHEPANPNGKLDVIQYAKDSGPRFSGAVAWGHGIGQWLRVEEFEAGRPKSPLELVAQAIARGEKAPVVGAWVAYSHDFSTAMPIVDVRRVRARVRTVYSMDEVDLDVYPATAPPDPIEPDRPIRVNVRSRHARLANAYQVKVGRPECWEYADEGLIADLGPIERYDLVPPKTCTACGAGVREAVDVWIGRGPIHDSAYVFTPPTGTVCAKCLALVRLALGLPEVEAKAPTAPEVEPADMPGQLEAATV